MSAHAFPMRTGLKRLPVSLLGCSGGSFEEGSSVLEALDALCPSGQSFLHTAVASGSAELVQLLGEWGRGLGLRWGVAAPGAQGITPLHLAALARNPALLQALWGECLHQNLPQSSSLT
jgi:hypothetical protein